MVDLSEDDCVIIRCTPLQPAIGHLRASLQKVIETDANAGIDSQEAESNDASSDKSAVISPKRPNAQQDSNEVVSSLLLALLGHRVARKLRLRDTGGTVAGQLAGLYGRLDSDQIRIAAFFPLVHTILQKESDVEIWKAVLQLIASAARTTPLPSSKPSFGGTPLTYSSASYEVSEQTRLLLDDALRDEFYNRTYEEVEGFFEKYFDGKSWTQHSKDIYDAIKKDHVDGRWKTFPEHPVELAVWKWVSQFQQEHLTNTRSMYYTTETSSEMTGIDANGQLGLLIKPRSTHTLSVHNWAEVRAVGEHRVMSTEDKFLQLAKYARNVFTAQPRRRFVHGFTFRCTLMELYVFDRSGAYSAMPFDIHAKPEHFIRALTGYCMMSNEELGMDTFTEREGIREFVTVTEEATGEDRRLELEQVPIARQSAVVCRGTCCYRTMDGRHVAKFSWVAADKWLTEPGLLATAHEKNVKGVAQLVGRKRVTSVAELREDLTFAKKKRLVGRQQRAAALFGSSMPATTILLDDSTAGRKRKSVNAESFAKNSPSNSQASRLIQLHGTDESFRGSQATEGEAPFVNRILSCLAVKPAGRPLDSFRSVAELLRAFRDAIKAHRSLFLDGKILHRDISQNNIIITDPEENEGFSGMLIDLDLATQVDEEGNNVRTGNPGMTGTLKFMAIEVVETALWGSRRDLEHTYRHDLESFFYVFLSICINCGWDAGKGPKVDLLSHWYIACYESIASMKTGHVTLPGFEKYILAKFSPTFQSLRDLAMALRDYLFLRGSHLQIGLPTGAPSILYDQMIAAFDHSIKNTHD